MHTIQLQKSRVAARGCEEAYPQLSFSSLTPDPWGGGNAHKAVNTCNV